MDKIIERLQAEVKKFLTSSSLKLNDVFIRPTEVEIYYYRKGEFEDESVHRNVLQQNNKNHFYIHRRGKEKNSPYMGGNRPGIDFVLSDRENVYYTYLIRSAIVNGKPIIGPHKVLKAIKDATNLPYEVIENTTIEVVDNDAQYDVLFSMRINLSERIGEYRKLKLRAIICDDWFKGNKYRAKEQMIIDFLSNNNIPKENAIEYAQKKLGYIPSILK